MLGRRNVVALGAVATFAIVLTGCGPSGRAVNRASVASDESAANQFSFNPSISSDGRYVVFQSWASNLVPGDTNGIDDIFIRDGEAGTTERVNVSSGGAQANQFSIRPSVSDDGRFIAFGSDASNLVPNDTNGVVDMFVRDRESGTTERVNVALDGSFPFAYSGDSSSSISGDGRYVTFWSAASNLVQNDTNASDVFVRDRQAGVTERISVASDGTQGNNESETFAAISNDGRFVAFASRASNLVANDTNGQTDLFVHDRQSGLTERISVSSGEQQTNAISRYPVLSANGRYVAFLSDATNLVGSDTNGVADVFVRDRELGLTVRVNVQGQDTQANGSSFAPSISPDGNYVAFASDATNLELGDINGFRDIFIRDVASTGFTIRVNRSFNDSEANAASHFSTSISNNGRFVAFASTANNLIVGDTNGVQDIFVRDQTRPTFDNMFPTTNYDLNCVDGDLDDTYCQTDDASVDAYAENSVGDEGRQIIEDILVNEYQPTDLDVVLLDEDPIYEGDQETDIIYQREPGVPEDKVGIAWCNDSIDEDTCDQHYVRFKDGEPLPVSTTCHETGHAVGLTHGSDATPQQDDLEAVLNCMKTPSAGNNTLGVHNIDQINSTYP